MSEYCCTAVIDGVEYQYVTYACVTQTQAIISFDTYLFNNHDVLLDMATSLSIRKILV